MMLLKIMAGWMALTWSVLWAVPGAAMESMVIKSPQEKMSYAVGVNLFGTIKQQGGEFDLDAVIQGMRDASAGGKLQLTAEELRVAIGQYQIQARQRQVQLASKRAEDNKAAGEAFLAENMKKEGVVTLPSGLQYTIIKAGKGKRPGPTDVVECHYRAFLINGNEFDNSSRTEAPSTYKVDEMIPGWREALQLMPVGSTWRIFIPSDLAYGKRGKGGPIGPNTALIYEIELLAIK